LLLNWPPLRGANQHPCWSWVILVVALQHRYFIGLFRCRFEDFRGSGSLG